MPLGRGVYERSERKVNSPYAKLEHLSYFKSVCGIHPRSPCYNSFKALLSQSYLSLFVKIWKSGKGLNLDGLFQGAGESFGLGMV